jgi:hypothetical protein
VHSHKNTSVSARFQQKTLKTAQKPPIFDNKSLLLSAVCINQSKALAPIYYRIARWINDIVIAGAVREPPLRPAIIYYSVQKSPDWTKRLRRLTTIRCVA